MDNNFDKKSIKFFSRGLQVSKGVGATEEGYFLDLNNVRQYQDGVLRQRPGMVASTSTGASSSIHSFIFLNNDVTAAPQSEAIIAGAGTELYTSNSTLTSLTSLDSGYSGDPLTIVTAQPASSPEPWAYVGDSARLRKVNSSGTNYPIGIAQPTSAVTAGLGAPTRKVIDDFDNAASWTQGGTAGAPAATANNRVNTTITAIKYDTGTSGWACVVPAAMTADIQPGLRLTFGAAAETAVVEEVFNTATDSTIGSILYDSGTSGLCTIQLGAPAPTGLRFNQLIYNSTRTEYVKILGVTIGPGGNVSLRVSTSATFAVADVIQVPNSFRVYLTGTRAAADALKATYTTTNITVGTGTLSQTVTLDLSVSGSSGRAFTEEDDIHISVRVSDLTRLIEGKVKLDIDGTTNDFTKNFFYYAFRPNDLTSVINNLQTSVAAQQVELQRSIDEARLHQRDLLEQVKLNYYHVPGWKYNFKGALITHVRNEGLDTDPGGLEKFGQSYGGVFPGSPSGGAASGSETASGQSQWSEIVFKVKDLVRVGADLSKTLKDVKAIQVEIRCSNTVDCDFDSWWIGGSYGPDSVEFPLNYRFRYRSSTTGAISNPSPEMRSPIEVHRAQVAITGIPTSSDGQVDFVDIFRIGGTVTDYTYVGSVANGTSTFNDFYLDSEILSNDLLDFDNFQPFPILDTPKTSVCDVSGTKVKRISGATFNTSWAPGSIVIVDGVPCTLYGSPSSTTMLELQENVGTKSSVTVQFPAPTLLGQPMPVLFGPYGGGETGIYLFGLGHRNQEGTLFWTKGNNPDAAPDVNQLEITTPSEKLITGCIFDGRPYVFTGQRMYLILRNDSGTPTFTAQEVAGSKGVFSRWGVAVGDKIYFISPDGIYETSGGAPTCITDDSLRNLFAQDANFLTSDLINVQPLNLDQSKAKLAYVSGFLYFTYVDRNSVTRTLIYDTKRQSWFRDTTNPITTCYRGRTGAGDSSTYAGAVDGKIYFMSGSNANDNLANNVTTKVLTRFEDMGSPRLQKYFKDLVLDLDRGGANVSVDIYINNDITTPALSLTVNSGSGRQQVVIDLGRASAYIAGEGILARNIAIQLSWTNNINSRLFEWTPSWVIKQEITEARFTDWQDGGYYGDKRVTAVIIDADTFNVQKFVEVQSSDTANSSAFTTVFPLLLTHNGQKRKTYSTGGIGIGKLFRLAPQDEVPWYLEGWELVYEKYPENTSLIMDFTDDGNPCPKWLQGFELEADTGGLPVQVDIRGDNDTVLSIPTINHAGRSIKPYVIAPTAGQLPITHSMRLVSAGNMRFWKVKWFWKEEPELVTQWVTPGMTLTMPGFEHAQLGYFHLRDCYIVHRSTADITFVINVDGVDTTLTIPNSGGIFKKDYLVLPPLKGKAFQFRLSSTVGFRLYGEDCEIRAKSWGTDAYNSYHPFGINRDWEHSSSGAEI